MTQAQNHCLKQLLNTTTRINNLKGVSGVILAAGLGKRMGQLTQKIPKPLLPVLNCPLVGWSISQMHAWGIQNISMNTYYLSEMFTKLIPATHDAGINLNLIRESILTGPFGGVISCSSHIKEDIALVFTGDSYFEIDLERLINTHFKHGADLTLGVAPVENGSNYGVVNIENNIVISMVEKPKEIREVEYVSCGVYIVSHRLIHDIRKKQLPLDWVDVVNYLIGKKRTIAAEQVTSWIDSGTPADFLNLNLRLLTPKFLTHVANKYHNEYNNSDLWLQDNNYSLPKDLEFEGTVLLGEKVSNKNLTKISNSIIGGYTKIGKNVHIKNSVIFPGAIISDNEEIKNRIVLGH